MSHVAGTFTTGGAAAPDGGAMSGTLMVPAGTTFARLVLTGLDANNRVKTQKATAPEGPWADQTTYSADAATSITVAAGERWRIVQLAQQAIREIRYSITA